MLKPWTTASIIAALVITVSVIAASAQIQTRGAAGLHAQIQNVTPRLRQAACRGWGPYVHLGRPASVDHIVAGASAAIEPCEHTTVTRRS